MEFIVFLIGVIVAGLLALLFAVWRRAKQKSTSITQEVAGICGFAVEQTVRKQANKQKAMVLLVEKGELGNEEIRHVLGVSRQSVARYMTELEKEGKVRQVSNAGRGVVYRLKNDSTG